MVRCDMLLHLPLVGGMRIRLLLSVLSPCIVTSDSFQYMYIYMYTHIHIIYNYTCIIIIIYT